MKFDNAAQIIDFIAKSMESIAIDPAVITKDAMVRRVSVASGISRSSIEKFYYGRQRNQSVSNIDKLLNGVKKVKQELAKY